MKLPDQPGPMRMLIYWKKGVYVGAANPELLGKTAIVSYDDADDVYCNVQFDDLLLEGYASGWWRFRKSHFNFPSAEE